MFSNSLPGVANGLPVCAAPLARDPMVPAVALDLLGQPSSRRWPIWLGRDANSDLEPIQLRSSYQSVVVSVGRALSPAFY